MMQQKHVCTCKSNRKSICKDCEEQRNDDIVNQVGGNFVLEQGRSKRNSFIEYSDTWS